MTEPVSPPRQPILNAPASVLGLIAVLIAIHLVIVFRPIPEEVWLPYALVPARYLTHSWGAEQLVPLASHMFLHGSFLHLFVNCLWLLAFGPVVARRLGGALFFLFFILSGVAGAFLQLAFTWGQDVPMIGASGAIAGLMAAGFRMMHWSRPASGEVLAPILSRPILTFTGIWLVTNVIFGITGIGTGSPSALIAWQAHMGGYLYGLFTIGIFDRMRHG